MKSSLALISLWLGLAGLAHAHAFLDHADPRVGSTVSGKPRMVMLWMTESLEPAFTHVRVYDARGNEVDRHDEQVSGATMMVDVPKLPPGRYTVKWSAVATDTHHTTGTFGFTVK